jgi:two-component system chemotaxis sensor kinase CheA
VLELLVTSVLEADLFSLAVDIGEEYIRLLPKDAIYKKSDVEQSGSKNDDAGSAQLQNGSKNDNAGSAQTQNGSKKDNTSPTQTQNGRETSTDYAALSNRGSKQDAGFAIRLDVSAINGLMDLANEMILTRNQLLSATNGHSKSIPGLTSILHNTSRLTSEIQEKVMFMRMQPLSVVFNKFPRIIRDTAKALGKEIQVDIHGSDVRLDNYLLDSLADPIAQIVKNSVDHGLEHTERRLELGKSPKGRITLSAYMRDGAAIIEISDDGAGIDADMLKRRALEKGLTDEETLAAMPDKEAFALMMEPGISTAKEVTSLSGRGVGMDIVKTNIEKLGGTIEIDSETGRGTNIIFKMPPTLSVVRTLIVKINLVQYAVPEMNVERIVRIWQDAQFNRVEILNNSLVLSLRGWIIPIVTMAEIEAKAANTPLPSAKMQYEQILSRGTSKYLVLKAEGRVFALLIDDAVRTEETLVKPLPDYLKNCICYSNVTVLGDGNAIMVLDAEGIINHMGIETTQQAVPVAEIGDGAADSAKTMKQIIIFKCSDAEHFAIETGDVSRIEYVDTENIQQVGENHYINISGKSIRIIRPEDYAPVKKQNYTGNRLYMLTLKNSEVPMGLLAGKVLDKIEGVFELDRDSICGDFVAGTSVFDEKILVFLDYRTIVKEAQRDCGSEPV